jgi:hypothetical protein
MKIIYLFFIAFNHFSLILRIVFLNILSKNFKGGKSLWQQL